MRDPAIQRPEVKHETRNTKPAFATRDSFFNLARARAKEAAIPAEIHGYFEQHRDRLWQTVCAFDLLSQRREHFLDIGPYFSYTPFLWKEHAADHVTVFDGAAPEPMRLERCYRDHGIDVRYGDLFQIFDGDSATKRLPYADESFDAIACWETMEHFNFNPVPFVRELHRVTRKGGVVCITVPNLAKLDKRLKLARGRSMETSIDAYFANADSKFYGFHWREYTLAEITELFRRVGFGIELSRHLQTFENRPVGALGKCKRLFASAWTSVFPGGGALCLVKARK
jgi:SAM-dependent methyltransferase